MFNQKTVISMLLGHATADAIGVPGGTDISKQVYIKPVRLADTFSHG